MPDKLNVLFLPHPVRSLQKPWEEDIVAALSARHHLTILEDDKPLAPQFDGIDVVVDFGGMRDIRDMVAVADSVRFWQVMSTGLDHVDLDTCRSRNIPVSNTPGPFSAVALAECAMMFALMLTRFYKQTQANLKSGNMYWPAGIELEGLKLGILGFGASGTQLARRALSFGMKIMAVDTRHVTEEEIREYRLSFVGGLADLDQMIAESDILSLHIPLNERTRHIIDARRLGLMKSSAYLINIARGGLVDEAALEKALENGQIAGAGLDVFSLEPPDLTSPLFSMPNVITTPHIAGATDGTSRKRATAALENVDRIAAGLEPLYRVA